MVGVEVGIDKNMEVFAVRTVGVVGVADAGEEDSNERRIAIADEHSGSCVAVDVVDVVSRLQYNTRSILDHNTINNT